MKTRLLILIALIFVANTLLSAQDLNWVQAQNDQKQFLSAQVGAEYGTILGLAYGHRLGVKQPAFVSAEFSSPFGHDLLDDWKLQFAYQRRLWHHKNLALSIKPGLLLRAYDSNIAQMLNIGLNLNTSFGYYRPKWFLTGEFGVDQTLATHLQQGFLKELYPEIYNGWIGSSGGNFRFGGAVGCSFGKQQIAVHLGKVFARNFQDNPTIPFYFELNLLRMW